MLPPACDETNDRKSLKFGQEKLQTSEKENNDNLDQYLNIDNLPKGDLQLKAVYKINSGNVLIILVCRRSEIKGTAANCVALSSAIMCILRNPKTSTLHYRISTVYTYCRSSRLNPRSARNLCKQASPSLVNL